MGKLSLPVTHGRTLVVAAGKAALPMAAEYVARDHALTEGIAVSPDTPPEDIRGFRCIKARHPVPDASGAKAAAQILAAAEGLQAEDTLVVLLSGGASALLASPAPGITLEEKQKLTTNLLSSGAAIEDINLIRKHLSQIKGGRLAAAAAPARCLTFAISDVTGNDPAIIASGPTWPAASTPGQAIEILNRYKIPNRERIIPHILPLPNFQDPEALKADYHLIATPQDALAAAQSEAKDLGINVINLGCELIGEAREAARDHAAKAKELAMTGQPAVILSGGEFTVTGAHHEAIGGPNHEFALALAIELDGNPQITAFAGDTDGKDGNTGAAGAFVFPDTLKRARAQGLDPVRSLKEHRSGSFFADLGDVHAKGSTGTNVNDFRALLINWGR